MYNEGGGAAVGAGGVVTAGALAQTGFSVLTFTLVAFTLLLLGAVLTRRATAGRRRGEAGRGGEPQRSRRGERRARAAGPGPGPDRGRSLMRPRLGAVARILAGALLAVLGALVLVDLDRYRQGEAQLLARLARPLLGSGVHHRPGSATVYVGLGTDHGVGLSIDRLCSTGGVVGVVLLVTGLLLAFADLRVRRGLLAAGVMAGIVVAVNAARLMALSWSVDRWGLTGWFEWLHLYGGAALSMLAVAVGCVAYLRTIRRASGRPA